MPFDQNESNLKLKAPEGETNYAVEALKTVNDEAEIYIVTGNPIPDTDGHFQGVTIPNGYAVLSTTADNGVVMNARRQDQNGRFALERSESVLSFDHPGGIQAIGRYVAVPVYYNANAGSEKEGQSEAESEIQFFDYKQMKRTQMTIKLGTKRPYCLGIANLADDDGEFYLLVVGINNKGTDLEFYRSTPDKPLSDPDCEFTPCGSWHFSGIGFRNSMSLIADEADNVYFVGLHTRGLFAGFGSGQDRAVLYEIAFEQGNVINLTERFDKHLKCKRGFLGPAFRWGGSVMVTSPTSLQVFACGRDVLKNQTEARLNIFKHPSDSAFGV